MPRPKLKCSPGWKEGNFDQSKGEVIGCIRKGKKIIITESFKETKRFQLKKFWKVRRVEDHITVGETNKPSKVSAVREAVSQMDRLNRIEARKR